MSDTNLRSLVAPFAKPVPKRAVLQLVDTVVPFLALWALMVKSVDWGYGWTLLLALPTAGLYIRAFIIQHDCGHGSFFARRKADHAVGAFLGLLTLFPYGYWKKTHAIHHATSGNLDHREFGDVTTLTVREYQALPRLRKFGYRLYRSAWVLLFVGPVYQFAIKHRFPFDIPFAWKREWASVLWNNLALAAVGTGLTTWLGWEKVLLVQLPIIVVAGAAGVWLFYVQHQFEETHWSRGEQWQLHHAALEGSSHYVLPQPLQWLSGNIGIHHVHHLYSRIPFYRLPEVLRDHRELAEAQRLTIGESLATVRLHLWDETEGRLVSFAEVRARSGL